MLSSQLIGSTAPRGLSTSDAYGPASSNRLGTQPGSETSCVSAIREICIAASHQATPFFGRPLLASNEPMHAPCSVLVAIVSIVVCSTHPSHPFLYIDLRRPLDLHRSESRQDFRLVNFSETLDEFRYQIFSSETLDEFRYPYYLATSRSASLHSVGEVLQEILSPSADAFCTRMNAFR